MEDIRALNVRLNQVCIEHLEWEKCITLYDRPGTFFFVDPPYTECGRTMYDAWTNTDVQVLRDRLAAIRGMWMVTLNDTPAIRAIFSGCKFTAVQRPMGISRRKGQSPRQYAEVIILP